MKNLDLANLLATMRESKRLIEQAIENLPSAGTGTSRPIPMQILEDFSAAFRTSKADILRGRNRRECVDIRKTMCFVLRHMGYSYEEIARFFDVHFHTVRHNALTFKESFRYFSDANYEAAVLMISKYVVEQKTNT